MLEFVLAGGLNPNFKEYVAERRRLRPGKYVETKRFFVVHPDIQEAYVNYDGTKDSFKEVFEERDKKLKDGEVYWNDSHDEEMRQTAEERTVRGDFKYPEGRKHRKTSKK